jgi:glyoxylase-like metal-dependent hydrolase (beta-lactamase superfamily II)
MLAVFTLNATAQKNIYKYRVGSYVIYLLSEGDAERNTDILIDATDEMLKQCVPEGKFLNAINCFFLEAGKETFLFDTGLGINLFDNLRSLRRTPEEINGIFMTHLHGDHFGGLTKDDERSFPNAKVYIPKPEYDYWMSDEAKYADNARKVLKMYENDIILFEPGTFEKPFEIIKGIKGIAIYGHTPGHTGYLVESDNNKIFIWGDVTHAMAIQMPYPQVAVTYDSNHRIAVDNRLLALKYLETNRIAVAGMHIPFPGMGHIVKQSEQSYDFVPIDNTTDNTKSRVNQYF